MRAWRRQPAASDKTEESCRRHFLDMYTRYTYDVYTTYISHVFILVCFILVWWGIILAPTYIAFDSESLFIFFGARGQ